MLYPDFQELVALGHKASRLSFGTGRKSLSAASGDYTSPFRGQGLSFHEVREYRPGDDIRSIDWRVTARSGKPHMKVFTEERERTVILCIDVNAGMRFGTRGTFKSIQAARAAALLGWQAQRSHDRVGSVVFGDVPGGLQYFTPVRARQALWQTLKLLSREDEGKHTEFVSLEDTLSHLDRAAPTGSLIFIISDFHQVTETLEKRLINLHRRCDIILVTITDPADCTLPAVNTILFSNGAGNKLAIDTSDATGREAYARNALDIRMKLEDIATRRNIGIVDLYTNRDIVRDLASGLRRLNMRRIS
jgi:uncharacterized protein (DUF58 family)